MGQDRTLESYKHYHSAEYQRARRAKLKANGVVKSKPRPQAEYIPSEEELMAEVTRRGRILTSMMRTPACMWPAEWTEDL